MDISAHDFAINEFIFSWRDNLCLNTCRHMFKPIAHFVGVYAVASGIAFGAHIAGATDIVTAQHGVSLMR